MNGFADNPSRKLRKPIILIGACVALAAALFVAYVVLLALIS